MKLYWKNGCDLNITNVYEFAKTEWQNKEPLFYWLEPKPCSESRKIWGDHVQCLTKTLPPIPLEQVKLFFQNGMVHIIATENGCRWFECSENNLSQSNVSKVEEVTKTEKDIYLKTDYERFGIKNNDSKYKVKAIVYYKNSNIFTWRIVER